MKQKDEVPNFERKKGFKQILLKFENLLFKFLSIPFKFQTLFAVFRNLKNERHRFKKRKNFGV